MARFTTALILTLFVLTRRNSVGEPLNRTSGHFTPNPIIGKQDAFTPSEPHQGKVFLYPWRHEERMGDWYYNRAYCAYHNAEMVTIRDEKENDFFYNFMHQVGMKPFGVWLGAQSNDKQRFTHWNNNEVATYQPVMPGEYNELGLTCVDMSFYATERKWRNWYCAGYTESKNHHIACQRRATPVVNTCDDVDGQMTITTTETQNCFCMPIMKSVFVPPIGGSHCNLHNIACRHGTSATSDCVWTVTTTDSHYCVCVPTDNTNVQLCPKTNDLLVVLDSSDSISPGDYDIAKRFIDRLVTALMVNRKSRVSFTTYSTDVTLEFSVQNNLGAPEISAKILNSAHHADGTNTHLGIVTALDDYKTAARKEVVNMVLLTDGRSKDLTATADAVKKAHDLNIRTYAVGIGSDVNQEELLMIASGDANGVYTTATFSELVKILAPISKKLCSD